MVKKPKEKETKKKKATPVKATGSKPRVTKGSAPKKKAVPKKLSSRQEPAAAKAKKSQKKVVVREQHNIVKEEVSQKISKAEEKVDKPESEAIPRGPAVSEKKEPVEIKIQPPVAEKAPDRAPEIILEAPAEPKPAEKPEPKVLELEVPIPLKELALKLGVKPNELIVNLMAKNVFATINQNLGEDVVVNILHDRGIEFKKPEKIEDQMVKEHRELEEKQDVRHLAGRPPVVTFMGHVDHGKTSLLDFIRKTRVVDREKGGITQHIGAYEVKLENGSVTFLDTPGHKAFTAMRARGANATDVVVLVIAADDGVMPQTKEALDHAMAAGVTVVVAINKCDLPSANIEKVKGQLSQLGLTPEDWGGKTIVIPVSAKTGEGVERLLEMLLLESELLELKANPGLRARGVVIEGKLSSGQGPVATILVKNGTLKVGDMVLTGMHYGRIKAMMDHTGRRIDAAPPSKPVSILGLSGVPMAGDEFFMVKDEKKAKTLSLLKQDEERNRKIKSTKRVTLEGFYSQLKDGITKKLTILMKGDVQGSIEAIKSSLLELSTKDVEVELIHADVGNINESDIMLALASNAVVIGFNVKVEEGATAVALKEGIDIKIYEIIYKVIEDVTAAMEGMLEPVSKEVFVGRAMVKQVFRVSKVGTIAGSQVVKGKITRSGKVKLVRNKNIVYEGKISSLKRFKDDVRDVTEGVECGIGLDRHDDIKAGDLIEMYQIEKVARRLDSNK